MSIIFFCFLFIMHISVIFYKTRLLFLCLSYVFFFIRPSDYCFFIIAVTLSLIQSILFLDLLLIFRLFLFFVFILLFNIVLSCLLQHLYLTNKRTIFPLPDLSFYDRITLIQWLDNLAIAFFLTRTEVRYMKPVNQQQIKDLNMKRLYASIYSTPGISRAELAKRTKLSKTTVSTLVDELIERAFIQDNGIVESTALGRRPNSLHIRRNSHYIVVFNWYENQIYTHLVDIAGTSVFQEVRVLSKADPMFPPRRKVSRKLFLRTVPRTRSSGSVLWSQP